MQARFTQAADIEVVLDHMQAYSVIQIKVIPPQTMQVAIVARLITQTTMFPATLIYPVMETPPTKSKSALSSTNCLRNTKAHHS